MDKRCKAEIRKALNFKRCDFSAVQIEHMVQSTHPGDVERLQAQAALLEALPETKRKTTLLMLNAQKH